MRYQEEILPLPHMEQPLSLGQKQILGKLALLTSQSHNSMHSGSIQRSENQTTVQIQYKTVQCCVKQLNQRDLFRTASSRGDELQAFC